ncbi:hypothetical protein F442_19655, partial [Phytophthora nicotianae P10297]
MYVCMYVLLLTSKHYSLYVPSDLLKNRLRKLKSHLKRCGYPMEAAEFQVVAMILGGMPLEFKKLHLESELHNKFTDAEARVRYHTEGQTQTVDLHLQPPPGAQGVVGAQGAIGAPATGAGVAENGEVDDDGLQDEGLWRMTVAQAEQVLRWEGRNDFALEGQPQVMVVAHDRIKLEQERVWLNATGVKFKGDRSV